MYIADFGAIQGRVIGAIKGATQFRRFKAEARACRSIDVERH